MKKLLRKILIGDREICEYATITIAGGISEKVFLKTGNALFNITHRQWLFCLNPVVFGIWVDHKEMAELINNRRHSMIYFCNADDEVKIKHVVATGELEFHDKIEEQGGTLFLLTLKTSRLFHINPLKIALLFHRYYKKPTLTFDTFKSLATAYSFPRRVRIVSFRQGDFFNIFPMDLLGEISPGDKYIFGLRHTNITLNKIMETGKVAVSEIPFAYKKTIYELGKHHGSNPPALSSLPFKTMESKQFKFHIPEWADSYKEIEITRTINLGSHMLLWGDVIYQEAIRKPSPNLCHIHFLEYLNQKNSANAYRLV